MENKCKGSRELETVARESSERKVRKETRKKERTDNGIHGQPHP